MRRSPSASVAFAALLALAGVAGCGDDEGDAEGAGATGTTTTTTTTTEPEPTDATDGEVPEPGTTSPEDTIAPTTLPPPAEPACPGAPLPAGALDEVGWADVDGDGRAELWVRTGAGASAVILGVIRWDADCAPTWVELDGIAAELPVGGSVANAAGLVCDTRIDPTGDLTVYSASSADGETYEVTARELRLEGDQLVEVATDTSIVAAGDPAFGRFTGFSCGSLVL